MSSPASSLEARCRFKFPSLLQIFSRTTLNSKPLLPRKLRNFDNGAPPCSVARTACLALPFHSWAATLVSGSTSNFGWSGGSIRRWSCHLGIDFFLQSPSALFWAVTSGRGHHCDGPVPGALAAVALAGAAAPAGLLFGAMTRAQKTTST